MRLCFRFSIFGLLAICCPAIALAAGGTIKGKVEATPAKYLEETVIYLKEAKGNFKSKKVSLDQKGMKFIPHVLTITAGDTVEFLNHDGVDHNVFSPDNETYNLGMIKASGTGSYTFKRPGVYSQLCSVHPEMLAYVFVGQNPYQAVVDAKGNFKIEQVPVGTYQLGIWNSHLKAPEQAVTVSEAKTIEASFSLKR
jgi:plastocyanin